MHGLHFLHTWAYIKPVVPGVEVSLSIVSHTACKDELRLWIEPRSDKVFVVFIHLINTGRYFKPRRLQARVSVRVHHVDNPPPTRNSTCCKHFNTNCTRSSINLSIHSHSSNHPSPFETLTGRPRPTRNLAANQIPGRCQLIMMRKNY